MDTKNLLAHVAKFGLPAPDHPDIPRYVQHRDGFTELAQALANGAVPIPPRLLHGRDRRRHIRNTIIEDHVVRMQLVPDAVRSKLDDLASDPFLFFRGTALLFYRDLVGSDLHLPVVPVVGDVHPENFGILPGGDGQPIFSVNDLDEAWMAPFTWDVERGAVGFGLAAQLAGAKKKKVAKVIRAFIEGYFTSIGECLEDPSRAEQRFIAADVPKVIRPFFRKAQRDRDGFLAKRIDFESMTFREDDRTHRHPEFLDALEPALTAYADSQDRTLTVHDLAIRQGSGTASRGLTRFWFLVEEDVEELVDDQPHHLILEMKMSRASSLEGLVPDPEGDWIPDSPAERIAMAFNAFVKDGDPYYGFTDIAGISFLVRERGPQKVNISTGVMDKDDLRDYAEVCGRVLGIQHVRADGAWQEARQKASTSSGGQPAEPLAQRITRAASGEVFRADTEEFAVDYLDRLTGDYELFREDLQRGAFGW